MAKNKYTDELKMRALSNWLDGMTDKENADILGVQRKETIKDWRNKYEWEKIKERYQGMFLEEWERKRAIEDAEEAIRVNKRHRQVMHLLASKIVAELRDGEPEETQFARIKTLKLATEAMVMIQNFERKIFGADAQDQAPQPQEHVFKVEGIDGDVIHIEQLQESLPNQNPHEYVLPPDVVKKKLESDIPVENAPIIIGAEYIE